MRTRTPVQWILPVAATSLLFVALTGLRATPQPPSNSGASPGARAGAPSSAPAPQVAGSSSCRACHEPFYEKWVTSHHGTAMQPFTAELAARLKVPAAPIAVRDDRFRVDLSDGQGWIVEERPTGEQKYAIGHALGGKNVLYFLTPLERGRLQVLPLAYDVRRQEWFDTTGSAARGLMHFQDEVLDWRAPQLTFNTSCHGCHVSQFSSNYDPQNDSYHSTWTEPGINCETCHAAGADHVRLFRDQPPGQPVDDIRIISTKRFSVEQNNALCAPCHAKAVALTDSFHPGARFFDNYDLVGPEHSDFYPDGRDLGENYTYTSWRLSPCVKSGQLGCLHCHTSSGRYRFAENTNLACAPCHQAHVDNPTAHTRHAPDSAGNQCVACHMPTTEFARMRRSDHSMRPPMPAATLAFHSPNACNACHTDQDASWSDRYVREWRSRDYQAPALRVAGLVDAARKADWARLPEMLTYVTSAARDEIFATALIRLLRSCEDARKWPALLAALQDPSPLVRASAAEALDDYLTSASVPALLRAVADDYRLVRVRAAASLAALPTTQLDDAARQSLTRATDELLALIRARPDDAAAHHNLGNFHAARGERERALASFERAAQLQPDNVAPLVNAALVHNALGQNDRAEACLRRALQADPRSAAANLNLGLLLGELGRTAEAEAALRAAFAADERSATAAYNLAVLTLQRQPDEALDWCRKAVALRPQEPKYAYTLAFFLRQHGARDEAIDVLRPLVAGDAPLPDAYALLGQIFEEQQRLTEAVELYRQGEHNARLPVEVRMNLAARAANLASR